MRLQRERRLRTAVDWPSYSRGFSMIEMAVTVAVLAVVAAIGFPYMVSLINSNRVTGSANEVLAGLQLARMEAIRANQRTGFCQSNNGTSCTTATVWQGWLVYSDRNRNNSFDANELIRVGNLRASIQMKSSSTLTSSRVEFRPDGLAYQAGASTLASGNFLICSIRVPPNENARNIYIAPGGRATVKAAVNVGVSCPDPDNNP